MASAIRRSPFIIKRLKLFLKTPTARSSLFSFFPRQKLQTVVNTKTIILGGIAASGAVTCAVIYNGFYRPISAEEQKMPIPVTSLRNRADSLGRIETPGKMLDSPANETRRDEKPAEKLQPVLLNVSTNSESNGVQVESVSALHSPEIPEYAPYLLIGAGTSSFAAFRAIKSRDPAAKILIVGEEDRLPYMRPPLSKELWFPPAKNKDEKFKAMMGDVMKDDGDLKFKQWNGRERSLYYEPDQFYTPLETLKDRTNGGVSVLKDVRVERIDARNQTAYLSNGKKIVYGKCLIATGGQPKNLEVFQDERLAEKVTSFRKVDDFFRLHDITRKIKDIVIVGGGFLGSELACAIAARKDVFGLNVRQIFPEEGNMAKVLPQYLSNWTTEKIRAEGVDVLNHTLVDHATVDPKSSKVVLSLSNGKDIKTDHVVVAVGIETDQLLAERSGLEVDDRLGGYRVNAELEARSNVWVAGDAACFYDTLLGRRRVEHHDHAVVSGRLAGGNMTGDAKPYSHQSMFWSDLGPEIGFEAVGLVDSALPTVGVFATAEKKDSPRGNAERSEANLELKEMPTLYDAATPTEVSSTASKKSDDFGRGVVFYLKHEIVVGILLWNVFNKMPIARKVLREHKRYGDLSEVAKLFDVYDVQESE